MHRTGFARLFDLNLVGFDGDGRSRWVFVGSDGALLFVAGFLHPRADFGRRPRQGLLSLQRRMEFVGQSQPVFGRGGFQASQRANRTLTRAFGRLDGFDKKVIGVRFALVGSRGFPDVHWPLHIAFYHDNVKRNLCHFSHYYDRLTQARFENKPLLQNDPGFLQEITSTAVEVRLIAAALPAASQSKQDYVGAQACAKCHASISRQWAASSHSRIFQHATAQNVEGNFALGKVVLRGAHYVLARRNGNYYITESDLSGKPWEHRIDYTLGSRRLQHYLTTLAEGRIVLLPPTWDNLRKNWVHNLDTADPDEALGTQRLSGTRAVTVAT